MTTVVDAGRDDAQARAAGRLAALGAAAGDRVVVLGRNEPRFLDVTLGCLRAGIVPVPLNTDLAPGALTELVDDADPAVVLACPEHAAVVSGRHRIELLDDGWPGDAAPSALAAWPQARPMHYTSGTTGRSKGVWSGLLGPDGGGALCEDERALWGFRADDVHLICSPLYHSAPHRFALNTLVYGGRVVILKSFDAGAALAAIAEHGVTSTFLVPTHLARMLDHPAIANADLGSLRWLAHAGAPCPEPLKRRVLERFPPGVVWEFYGSTEGQFSAIGPDEWLARPGSVGRARPGRRLAILDDDGRELAPGEVGTVYCSMPAFARFSYWRDEGKTRAAWRGDRFTAGDLGSLDDEGYLTLAGRRGDLIISGGVNVYPAEVERVLHAHPGVGEGAVFGVPDERWGERVCAVVVPARAASLDPEQLRAWLRDRLAGFQTPKDIVVTDDLPRTGSGKVLRGALAEAFDAGRR